MGAAVSSWVLLLSAGAFSVLFGLVVDGGNVLDARMDASRTAAQAARTGADELSGASVRNGGDAVAAQAAIDRAQRYLSAAGDHGTVRVREDTVTVTITGQMPTKILGIIGITALPIHETEHARGIEGQE